jgi:membrane protein implicated in regulation of membrane protease activity
MTAWKRYLLFQLPSWALVSTLVYLLAHWAIVSSAVAVLLVTAYMLKDLLLYRFLRRAYLPPPPGVVEQMVGLAGVTKQDLNPEGYIQVRGELWKAEAASPDIPIPAGTRVRITGAGGMMLKVRAEGQGEAVGRASPESADSA